MSLAGVLQRPALRVALLAAALALLWLGLRGIWDPDEGRYTNVAMHMLDSGDWLNPRRSDEVGHWTKPPLTYWAIASSVALFGPSAFAGRLPAALAYLFCVWLAWRTARRLAPGAQATAALAYATMLLTFGASQLITTDYLLAAWTGLAMWAFIEARFGGHARPNRWIALMWAAFALAFLTKGPPALLTLLVIVVFDRLMPKAKSHRLLNASGIGLFLLLAAPWYIAVIHGHPGLFRYFIGDEVVNRVTTNQFGRHGEWYGWLQVYAPTLLLGTLPWTPALWRWARALPASLRRWRDPGLREVEARWLLPALWLLLPLLVFCLSRSRMPLYLLPLFLPIALLVAQQRQREGHGLPDWRWIGLWALLLMGLKLASAAWPTHKDASQWAAELRARIPGPIEEVVFVEDMARYGLHIELGAEVEKLSLDPEPAAPRFNPDNDADLAQELGEHERNVVWITKQARFPQVRARMQAAGYRVVPQGAPYQRRVIFVVEPLAP